MPYPALGGRVEQCSACGRQEYRYNSCRNRHCPRCQGSRRAAWLEREAAYLLPVEYHHVVFTLPAALAELARRRPRLVYGLLLSSSSAAVLELAADPKYLGARVGLVSMLHTWGQTLSLHPHVHVLATGGGLSCNRRGEVDDATVLAVVSCGFLFAGAGVEPLVSRQVCGRSACTLWSKSRGRRQPMARRCRRGCAACTTRSGWCTASLRRRVRRWC